MQRSRTLGNAFAWLNAQLRLLDLSWGRIKGLFRQAWDSLSPADLLSPGRAFARIRNIFGPPLARIRRFATAVGRKVLELTFEGFMRLAGPFANRILRTFRRARGVFMTVINNPVRFVGHLVSAVRRGFQQFRRNVLRHLQTGLMGWLFGALQGAGLTMPQRFDMRGILSIVLQVLGLTYQRLRAVLVQRLGERPVQILETTFEFLRTIVTQGLAAAWERIMEYVGNLRDMVIDGIRNWVVTRIIQAAVTRLVSMFNPAGAVFQAVMAIYNTIRFFIERAQQIRALVDSVVSSIGTIAAGNVGAAANFVEQAMGRTIPVIISFLARLIGLGGISQQIRNIISRIQRPVGNAINRLADFIARRARRLLRRNGDSAQVITDVQQAVGRELQQPFSSFDAANQAVGRLFVRFRPRGLRSLRLVEKRNQPGNYDVVASASPDSDVGNLIITTNLVTPAPGNIRYASDGQRPTRAWGWLSKKVGGRSSSAQSSVSRELNQAMEKYNLTARFDAGHLIADQFGGRGTRENLVPQERRSNRSWYKTYEGIVANHVRQAANDELIYADVKVTYPQQNPFQDILDDETKGRLPDNIREELSGKLKFVPITMQFTKLGKRKPDGSEVDLGSSPLFHARQALPSLGRALHGLINERLKRGRELFE